MENRNNRNTREKSSVPSFPEFYMGWSTDKDLLLKSSSGGAFSVLAETILEMGGVVFGAVKETGGVNVFHTIAKSTDELDKMRYSKYCQSNLGDIFKEVKSYLAQNIIVLFTGTTCQIGGLLAFLGNYNLENLVTVDILCHGVTSNKVISAYLTSQEQKFKKKIRDFSFRNKDNERGWLGGAGMRLLFSDGTTMSMDGGTWDTFFLGFNNNLFLRESCYRCCYCGIKKPSDLTIADFWHCNDPRVPDEQMMLGVSLILIHSDKGKSFLNILKKKMVIYEINADAAIPYNKALQKPQDRPGLRDSFYEQILENDYNHIIRQVFKDRYIKNIIKEIIKKYFPRRIAKKILKNP